MLPPTTKLRVVDRGESLKERVEAMRARQHKELRERVSLHLQLAASECAPYILLENVFGFNKHTGPEVIDWLDQAGFRVERRWTATRVYL